NVKDHAGYHSLVINSRGMIIKCEYMFSHFLLVLFEVVIAELECSKPVMCRLDVDTEPASITTVPHGESFNSVLVTLINSRLLCRLVLGLTEQRVSFASDCVLIVYHKHATQHSQHVHSFGWASKCLLHLFNSRSTD